MSAEVRTKNAKYEACLRKGAVELHRLSRPAAAAGEGDAGMQDRRFPEKEGISDVTCVQLTAEFLVYGTKSGRLFYHYLDEAAGPCLAKEHSHGNGGGGIRRLWPNIAGTRLLFEDDHHHIYLHIPVKNQAILVPQYTGELQFALWDSENPLVFVLSERNQVFVYIYSPVNIHCAKVSFLQASALPSGSCPVALQNGTLTCMVWESLISTALEHMELEIAVKACQYSRNIKLLMSLQQVQHIEEHYLLSGHIWLILGNFDAAQESFLKSNCPQTAITMRSDIEDWDQAMILSKELKRPPEAEILKEYAHALESNGDYRKALSCYEEFLKSSPLDPKLKYSFQAGVARTSIHLGDIWKGKQLAKECNNSMLYHECARILEGLNLPQDAAELYELDGQLEKAVGIYIAIKNHAKTQSLLKSIGSPKFYIMYAGALETERKFADAAAAYEAADEYDHAVRLYLGPLKNPSEAFAIVRKTRSMEGASMASKYCKNMGDYENAIEFLILQKRTKEASELAQQQDKMDVYTEKITDVASKEECLKLARYYEAVGNSQKATAMFERCGDPKQALRLYLSWGTVTAIEQAIDMVGRIRDDELTSQLLDFLTGEMEGADKSPHYLFRLHTTLGNYDLATKAALLIAQQEQEIGNYKIAHQQLLDLSRVLQAQQRRVPFELSEQLILLHSYILVKTLIQLGDHRSSARMLIRVARHISKFPAHVIPILISTVIECQRSGLKKTAFEYASMLMRPEFRNQITGTYKRKIENIVRKPERVEEDEQSTPCPFCQQLVLETQLQCPTCRNYLPFCIASGRHLVLGNWTKCPSCQFPALLTEFTKIIEVEKLCPMCWNEVAVKDIMEIADPIEDLRINNFQAPSLE